MKNLNIILIATSLFLSGCVSYEHTFKPLSIPAKVVPVDGVGVDIAFYGDKLLILPVWIEYPYFYFDSMSKRFFKVSQCFTVEELKTSSPPSEKINVLLGPFFSVGKKKVPAGYLVILGDKEAVYYHTDGKHTEIITSNSIAELFGDEPWIDRNKIEFRDSDGEFWSKMLGCVYSKIVFELGKGDFTQLRNRIFSKNTTRKKLKIK